MRTLHTDLTSAQQSSSSTPYIHLRMESFDRTDARSYATHQRNILSQDNSFQKTNTGTWVAGSSWTMTRVSIATEGLVTVNLPKGVTHCLKFVAPGGVTIPGTLPSLTITFNKHFGSFYALRGAVWGGGTITADWVAFGGCAVEGDSITAVIDQVSWKRVSSSIFPDLCDLNGAFRISPNTTPDCSDVIYIACTQIAEETSLSFWDEALIDNTNRIVSIQQTEGVFGSNQTIQGKPFPVTSVITLQNDDNSLTSLDFKGYRTYIKWGFDTDSGYKWSMTGPEFIMSQEMFSFEGTNYVRLFTIGLWEIANIKFVNTLNILPTEWIKGGINEAKVGYILQEILGGVSLGLEIDNDKQAIAQRLDVGFVDVSTAAGNVIEGDVIIFPATIQVSDPFYFGSLLKFDRISIDISSVLSSGSLTMSWEYYNGTSWIELSPHEETTHLDLSTSAGFFIEAFNIPDDWATLVLGVSSTAFFYVRAIVDTVTSPVGNVVASRIFVGQDFSYRTATTESTQGDDYLPSYTTNIRSRLAQVAADILSFTLMGVIVRPEGFHSIFIDNAQCCADYTYEIAGSHPFYIHSEAQQVIFPNDVTVLSTGIDGSGSAFAEGRATDADSIAQIGTIAILYVDMGATTDALATQQAERRIKQLIRDKLQGEAEVPMNVGQEVFDLVEVIDARTSRTTEGRLSQISRVYNNGQYRVRLILGGIAQGIEFVPLGTPVPPSTPRFIAEELEIPITPRATPRFIAEELDFPPARQTINPMDVRDFEFFDPITPDPRGNIVFDQPEDIIPVAPFGIVPTPTPRRTQRNIVRRLFRTIGQAIRRDPNILR